MGALGMASIVCAGLWLLGRSALGQESVERIVSSELQPGFEWLFRAGGEPDGNKGAVEANVRESLLQKWEGNLAWFRIEGDSIVAGSLKERIPHNEFLCTKKKYRNFVLHLEAKIRGEGDNAGVQFRTSRIPNNTEVSGYQFDMGTAWDRPVWGCLYDESRRNKMLAEGDPEHLKKLARKDDWNQLTLRCVNDRIELYLNGEKTVDFTETDSKIARDGIIGLQIHSGPPTEALYRNIQIKTLD